MAPRSEVGVLTLHRCINYGSYWQTRALVEGLARRGVDAVVLDHRSRRIDILEWRCALRPTLPTPVPRSDRPAYRRKVRSFLDAIATLPLSAPFDLEHTSGLERYRTVVIGSDEVWNLWHPFYTGQTLFFGHGLEHARKVSYAASFGHFDSAEGLGAPWCQWLGAFDAVSVRDENSRRAVASCGIDAAVVLDPCLQFDPTPTGEWTGGDGRFGLVYGHNFSPAFAAAARSWAADRRLQLVSVGYRNDWADVQWLDARPDDFAHAVVRADAVLTSFFHGTVFALRHRKRFVAEASPYRWNKVRGLLDALGAEHHLVDGACVTESFDRAVSGPIADAVLEQVEVLRRRSDEFLDDALTLAAA